MPRSGSSRKYGLLRYSVALAVACVLTATGPAAAEVRSLPFGFNESYVGVQNGATQQDKIGLTVASGGRLARTSLDWRCLEPAQDQWHEACWSHYQHFYDEAIAAGVTPMFSLIAAPVWAAAHPCRRHLSRNCAVPPARAYNAEWGEFAAEVARRFPVAVLEIWNEPNLKAFWNGPSQPKRYGQLVRIAYQGVKAASPSTRVLGGSVVATTGDNLKHMASGKFLRRAFGSDPLLAVSMDGLSFHMYGLREGLGPGSFFRKTIARMSATARHYLPPATRGLWLTETGVSTQFPDSLSAEQQAQRLWAVWRALASTRIFRGVVYHRLIEPKQTSAVPWEHGLAWTHYREPVLLFPGPIQPKPVFCHFAQRLGTGYAPCGG